MNIYNRIKYLLLAAVPVLGIYRFYHTLTYDLLLLSLFLVVNILYTQKLTFNKGMSVYFIFLLLISLISYSTSSSQNYKIFINNFLYIICFAILLSYCVSLKSNELFVKFILLVGAFSTFFLFYQTISYWFFNVPVTLFLPLKMEIPLTPDWPSITYGRPNSIFSEPSHYAIYVLPLLYHSLLNNKYLLIAIFTAGLFLSTSVTGIAVGLVIIVYHSVIKEKNFKILFIIAALGLISLFFLQDLFSVLLNFILPKINETGAVTTNVRLFSMLSVFPRMDIPSLIFGLGHNQLQLFMFRNGMPDAYNYANSFLMSIFSFGILGLIALIVFCYYLYKINNNKGYFLIFILILLSDQILFNRNFFYLVICIFFMKITEDKVQHPVLNNDIA